MLIELIKMTSNRGVHTTRPAVTVDEVTTA
jgi:hypothetical protein